MARRPPTVTALLLLESSRLTQAPLTNASTPGTDELYLISPLTRLLPVGRLPLPIGSAIASVLCDISSNATGGVEAIPTLVPLKVKTVPLVIAEPLFTSLARFRGGRLKWAR